MCVILSSVTLTQGKRKEAHQDVKHVTNSRNNNAGLNISPLLSNHTLLMFQIDWITALWTVSGLLPGMWTEEHLLHFLYQFAIYQWATAVDFELANNDRVSAKKIIISKANWRWGAFGFNLVVISKFNVKFVQLTPNNEADKYLIPHHDMLEK